MVAGEIDEKTVVLPAQPKRWQTFRLSQVRLLPSGPFHGAMTIAQGYLLDMDISRMLYRQGADRPADQAAGREPYPGSNQPADTRPGDCPHYISGASLMYAQTGDERFRERVDYLIAGLTGSAGLRVARQGRRDRVFEGILGGTLELRGPDEAGYPWGGMGNIFYGIHKWLAATRDAYLYCGNEAARQLWIDLSEPVAVFVLKANPDLFDGMLDLEHGGMNEVFADLYAVTGDVRYLEVSRKFNHQKVILNVADGKDVLYGRHANMQIPTFVGTARQFQLAGDEVSGRATFNVLDMLYRDHLTCIGGNSRYERFGRPGEITTRLGYTSCETCNTYNLLKVELQAFESSGEARHMDAFERSLYNHILASQDPESGGVTYYTSLMPGGFKAYSKRFDLSGIWCCVGTGMENHSKYGEAIFFHNHKDLLVNLFIPATLSWPERGLKLRLETRFPDEDTVRLTLEENTRFQDPIFVRYPGWTRRTPRVWINGERVSVDGERGGLIRLAHPWRAGDQIRLDIPQDFRLEAAADDPHRVAVCRGPLVMAGELGADRMPGSDLITQSLQYNDWIPPRDDIPVLVVDTVDPDGWLKPMGEGPGRYRTVGAGWLEGRPTEATLIPFFRMHHQRYNVYWKLFTPQEFRLRKRVVADEIDASSAEDERAHRLRGEHLHASALKDSRHFWENNRVGRFATNGGWFAYTLKVAPPPERQFLRVTYWGSSDEDSVFDVEVEGRVLAREFLGDRWPVTYFDEVYEVPEELVEGKASVGVAFRSLAGKTAGPVFALQWTSDPERFRHPLFY